jgi:hypothetical protein
MITKENQTKHPIFSKTRKVCSTFEIHVIVGNVGARAVVGGWVGLHGRPRGGEGHVVIGLTTLVILALPKPTSQ